jgi:tetratricopeptide (TPR) repeat protein
LQLGGKVETTSAGHSGQSLTDSLNHHDPAQKPVDSPPSPLVLGIVLVIVGAIGFSPWYVAKKAREEAVDPKLQQLMKNAEAVRRSHILHPGSAGVGIKEQAGLQFRVEGKYQDAISVFDEVLQRPQVKERRALNLLVRGDCYLNLGQYDKALDDFNKSILLVPDDKDAYLERATLYFRTGQKELYENDMATARSLHG